MEKLNFSIFINAPVEKVWNTMLEDETYREWTKPFDPTSRFEGNWEAGSRMKFLGTDPESGEDMGMVSRIAENRQYEYISIEHIGILKDGVEDTESEEAKKWQPAYENYTFSSKDGGTEVLVELDMEDEHKEMMESMFPAALQKLKELSEN